MSAYPWPSRADDGPRRPLLSFVLGSFAWLLARSHDVSLLEQSDFVKRTNGRSIERVHGGVCYWQKGSLSLVMEALRKRGILRRDTPRLLTNLQHSHGPQSCPRPDQTTFVVFLFWGRTAYYSPSKKEAGFGLMEGATMLHPTRTFGIFAGVATTVWMAAACSSVDPSAIEDTTTETGTNDLDTTTDTASETESSTTGELPSNCAPGAERLYLLDVNGSFYRFDPEVQGLAAFERISQLACNAEGQPLSMAVGRDGFAYVLYVTGGTTTSFKCEGIYQVDIETGLCGDATPFECDNPAGMTLFGMGFSADEPGGEAETLFLAPAADGGPQKLAAVALDDWKVSLRGSLPYSGLELTGDGQGELWALSLHSSPHSVLQLDKQTGAVLEAIPIPGLELETEQMTYAFAHWADAFFIFFKGDIFDASTNVLKLTRDGALTEPWIDIGLQVVGAGASTCVP